LSRELSSSHTARLYTDQESDCRYSEAGSMGMQRWLSAFLHQCSPHKVQIWFVAVFGL